MGERKSVGKTFLKGIGGIIFFLILFGILHILANFVSNQAFQLVYEFISQNLVFILLISFVMLFGDVFSALPFPLNIFYPLFNATGGALWVIFIYNIFQLIDVLVGQNISGLIAPFYLVALVIVFLLIIILGYAHVLASARPKRKLRPRPKPKAAKEPKEESQPEEKTGEEDTGKELKEVTYNLAKTPEQKLEVKDSKKATKKKAKKPSKKKAKKTVKKTKKKTSKK